MASTASGLSSEGVRMSYGNHNHQRAEMTTAIKINNEAKKL